MYELMPSFFFSLVLLLRSFHSNHTRPAGCFSNIIDHCLPHKLGKLWQMYIGWTIYGGLLVWVQSRQTSETRRRRDRINRRFYQVEEGRDETEWDWGCWSLSMNGPWI